MFLASRRRYDLQNPANALDCRLRESPTPETEKTGPLCTGWKIMNLQMPVTLQWPSHARQVP